ncbi:TldD/PmbA family protein [bacterium]|nr:TldD/PmbA family protein [bacterium]
MEKINLKSIFNQLKVNAEWFGIRKVYESNTYRMIRDGNPQANSTGISNGIMVEVLKNGQFAYAASSDMSISSIQEAIDKAIIIAESSAANPLYNFSKNVRPNNKGSYQSDRNKTHLPLKEINDILFKSYESLKVSDKIVSASATARITETNYQFLSSDSADIQQDFLIIGSSFDAISQDKGITQRRTDNGRGRMFQSGYEVFNESELTTMCKRIGEQAVELLYADECPTETTNLVLAPDQMLLQIHESIGHPLEVDRILGDERNYAGWSFVREEDFGNLKYGSDIMNITFDPTVKKELASYGFDDSGKKAEKEYIIKDGILLRGLGGTESEERSGIKGVANFRACSWNRPPIDRMANLNLEPGDSSFDDIISGVEKGVYMESNRSWSIDDYRNKFQFGCEYGKLIENGKLTKTIKNPNYRGVTTPFWNNLEKVGNSSTFEVFGTPNCGKGEPNQSVRVGHASPTCLFGNIEVFGGA